MKGWGRGPFVVGITLCLLGASGCALRHDMERALPLDARCPLAAAPEATRADPESDALVWYRAAEARDRELATRWCATVGAPVIELQPSGSIAAWSNDRALELVSWNNWIGGGDLFRLLDAELDVDCPPGGSGASSHRPFVLLLQEVWRASDDRPEVRPSRIVPWAIDPGRTTGEDPDIVEAARRCGLSLLYVPSARNGPDTGARPGEDKGNAILSSLPLSNPLAIDLPLEGGRKVAVAATVDAPNGRRLRVVSLHLDVGSTLVRTVFSGNQTRVRQAMGLVEGLEEAEKDGYGVDATVVGADMNTWAGNEAALERMWQAFPESPPWDGLPTRRGLPTDHVFFRADPGADLTATDYERIDDPYGSDHSARRVLVSPGASR